jgi:hypothetical protein
MRRRDPSFRSTYRRRENISEAMLQKLKQRQTVDRARLRPQEPCSLESADGLVCRALADTKIALKRFVRGLGSFGKSQCDSDIDGAKHYSVEHGCFQGSEFGNTEQLTMSSIPAQAQANLQL